MSIMHVYEQKLIFNISLLGDRKRKQQIYIYHALEQWEYHVRMCKMFSVLQCYSLRQVLSLSFAASPPIQG